MTADRPIVPALRPFLPSDAARCAAIFRASVEALTGDDYDDDQRRAWAAAADDAAAFGARLAKALTLIATISGEPVGFGSLKGADVLDMLYVDPEFARRGVGAFLIDALARLAAGRGAKQLTGDVSDTARSIFEKQGFVAQRRNLVERDGEWLANTTMVKALAAADNRDHRQPSFTSGSIQMTHERLYLFDTTMRDGAQTTGVDFSLEDKRQIAALLDRLGVDYVEGGYPGANPVDTKFFERKPTRNARFAAFGMTKRPGRSAENDPGVAALLAADADAIVFVAKSWDYHVHVALGCTLEENLDSIALSVKAAIRAGREAMLDCEHFFDGYKANPDYALRCARTAHEAGARWIVLCDTNGGTLPDEIERIVSEVGRVIPGGHLGIHAHNDTGNAVANSLAAVRAGARQIQGTLNGLGERCGNANLVSLIPTLLLKPELNARFETGVTQDSLAEISNISHAFDELLNRAPDRHAPYVGASAFATKAGIHASALAKDPRTYEHVPPESVGNARAILVSDQAGKSNLVAQLTRLGVAVRADDPRLSFLLEAVKAKEAEGYAYEGADASFELLARRILGETPAFFDVESFSVIVERKFNASGALVSASQAVVKIKVHGDTLISAAEGNGPVNALDLALRKDLGVYQRYIEDLELLDYRVRVFQGGTDAVTRVLIEFGNSSGTRWSTVGVSGNIIDASFQALVDAIVYKLIKAGVS